MQPVFIGGCARSGTTLLGAMLGTHSKCLATPESKFNLLSYKACLREKDRADPKLAYKKIINYWSFKVWDIEPPPVSGLESMDWNSHAELILWLVKLYGRKVGRPKAEIWVDHTPYNTIEATTLLTIFPEAKIIHLVRDGRAVASSVMKLDWGPNVVNEAAHWWIEKIAHGLAIESTLGKKSVIRIRYEDLLCKPKDVLQEICCFLQIEYEPEMISASGFRVPNYTSNQHALVGKGLDLQRLRAWESELTPRQIEIFESLTANFLTCMGYDLLFGVQARRASFGERMLLVVKEVVWREVVNWFRRRRRIHHTLSVDE